MIETLLRTFIGSNRVYNLTRSFPPSFKKILIFIFHIDDLVKFAAGAYRWAVKSPRFARVHFVHVCVEINTCVNVSVL